MLTAVTYARFSSDRQHESSIEAQHDAIDKYAQQRGIVVVEQYADRAKSGTNDNRPEFQRLISDLKKRPVDLVLVHKYDRFSRDRYDAAIYAKIIQQRSARLVAVAQDFGDSEFACVLEAIAQGFAEFYSKNLSHEVKKGRKVNIRKGRHAGGEYPFGYRPDPDNPGNYVIDEVEAYYIRKFYQAAIDGKPSMSSITDEMRACGIRGRRGGFLHPSNVAKILQRPIYMGVYTQSTDDVSVTIENHHPAIVSKTVYEEAMKRMEARNNVGRKPRRTYLCSGLVYCGGCGAIMYGHASTCGNRNSITYLCSKHCKNIRSIPVAELDQAACDYVAALLAPEVRSELAGVLQDYLSVQRERAQSRAPQINREIAKLNKQIYAITQNMSSGVLPPSVLSKMGDQIVELESQIEALKASIEEPPQVELSSIEDYFANAAAVSVDDDPVYVRKVLARFIRRITIHQTSIEFECTFNEWLAGTLSSGAEIAAHLCTLTEGSDNPKGVESPDPSKKPTDDDDPDDDPPRGSRSAGSSTPDLPASSSTSPNVSKSHTPCCRNTEFLHILIKPHIVIRNGKQPAPYVAEHHFAPFVQNN